MARAPAPTDKPDRRWPADKIELRAIGTLLPYARNARLHSEAQVDQIAASIKEWGWTNPVLVDEASTIIAGHGRVLAAHKLGITEIPVMVARGWRDEQVKAYRIADNKLSLLSSWDEKLLAADISELQTFDLSLLGFNTVELQQLLVAPVPPEEFTEIDESLSTEHSCPRCGYKWSGGQSPANDGTDEGARARSPNGDPA